MTLIRARRRPLSLLGAAFVALAPAAQALTNAQAMADAHAAMDALQRGDNTTAIHLFSLAIGSGKLEAQYQELAQVKRGEAFLAKHFADTREATMAARV